MKVVKTSQFNTDQLHIEDHIFESNEQQVKFVEKFIAADLKRGGRPKQDRKSVAPVFRDMKNSLPGALVEPQIVMLA